MATIGTLNINFQTNTATLISDMAKAKNAVGTATVKMSKDLSFLSSSVRFAASAFAAFKSVQTVTNAIDGFSELNNRIKVVSTDSIAAQQAMRGVLDVASATNSTIDQTARLYSRLSAASREMNLTQAQVLDMTGAINQTFRISGASAAEASASALQFAQALGSGRLQGDELRSILENNNRLARLFADGLGVSVGALKDLGSEGRLTSDILVNILLKNVEQLNKEATAIAPSFSGAFREIREQFTAGFLQSFIGDLNDIATALDRIGNNAARAGQWLGSFLRDVQKVSSRQQRAFQLAIDPPSSDLDLATRGSRVFSANMRKDAEEMKNMFSSMQKSSADLKKNATAGAVKTGTLLGPVLPEGETEKIKRNAKAIQELGLSAKESQQMLREAGSQGINYFGDQLKGLVNKTMTAREVILNALIDIGKGFMQAAYGTPDTSSFGGIAGGLLANLGFVSGTAKFSSRSSASLAASALGGAYGPGFASGGDFMVGGKGGTDNNLIQFMASRGERVMVQTPAQQKSMSANGSGNTYYIDAKGADSAAISRLEDTIRSLNGSIERRALAAVHDKFGRSSSYLRG